MPEHAKKLTASGTYALNRGTSFFDATKIIPGDEPGKYAANIPPDWCFGLAAHGGYLNSLLTRALDQHIQLILESTPQQTANTLNSSNITFFEFVVPGPAEIKIDQVTTSKHFCQFRVSLWQQRSKDTTQEDTNHRPSLKAEATITTASGASFVRNTLSEPLTPHQRIPQAEIFARSQAKHSLPQKDSGQSFYKYKPGYECYFNDTPSLDAIRFINPHPVHGRAVFDVWWKFDDHITLQHLGLLVDISGPVLLNFEELKKTHWLRTRQMSFDVVRLPPGNTQGWRWVFCRLEVTECVGDRFWQDVTCTDEEGNVICIAKHQCLLQPFEMLRQSRSTRL